MGMLYKRGEVCVSRCCLYPIPRVGFRHTFDTLPPIIQTDAD
jgi:hypothetical protein